MALSALLIAARISGAPVWLVVLLGVAVAGTGTAFLVAYFILLFIDRDALRSERFSLSKMAIEKSVTGDSLRGFAALEAGDQQVLAVPAEIISCTKIMGNMFKTAFLLTALTLLLMFIGRAFGGQNGMFLALAFAAVMNFVSYFYSDKIALAMYRAQPVTREELPRAYAAVERLTQKIGIPMPKIYVIPTESPNAFATGRNPSHASVAVTHGILGFAE
jgi:hypothetical protein